MNPEAIKHRAAIREARAAHVAGEISQAELYAVVDEYRAWMVTKVGKRRAGKFSRAYILRAI